MSHYRYSINTFRAMEPIIAQAIQRYPTPFEFMPSNVAAETARQRLQDACKWFDENNYVDVSFNKEIYYEARKRWSIGIARRGTAIYWGPRRTKAYTTVEAETPDSARSAQLIDPIDVNDVHSFLAVITLKNAGKLPGPVRVINTTPELCAEVEQTNDVSFANHDGNIFML
jgi:hypothetical protein